tara:strand:- start:61 stop:204 length:144 start_codon:yes stop_codon:yes gene_type:complete
MFGIKNSIIYRLRYGNNDKSFGKYFIDDNKMISAMLYKLIQVRKEKF